MLASILNLPRRRKSGSTSTPTSPPPSCHALGDACNGREEDGFLLVGESAIERSTVMPVGIQSAGTIAPPPSYAQVTTGMPTLPPLSADPNSHQGAAFITSPHLQQNQMQQRTSDSVAAGGNVNTNSTTGILNRSFNTNWGIVDVPFELSTLLTQSNRPVSYYDVPQIPAVDWRQYDYDFKFEANVKRDSELALERMDEDDEQGEEVEESNSQENLMKF